jgi:hypothetical protein
MIRFFKLASLLLFCVIPLSAQTLIETKTAVCFHSPQNELLCSIEGSPFFLVPETGLRKEVANTGTLDKPLTLQQVQKAELRAAGEHYPHRVLDGFDQFISSLLGAKNDQTISSQTEIDAHRQVWYSGFAKGLNFGLDLIQHSHGQLAQSGDLERCKELVYIDTNALKSETGIVVSSLPIKKEPAGDRLVH